MFNVGDMVNFSKVGMTANRPFAEIAESYMGPFEIVDYDDGVYTCMATNQIGTIICAKESEIEAVS